MKPSIVCGLLWFAAVCTVGTRVDAQLVGLRAGRHQVSFADFPTLLGPAALVVISPSRHIGLRAAFATAEGTRSHRYNFCHPEDVSCDLLERARTTGTTDILELGVMAFAPPLATIRFAAALSASRHDLNLNVVSRESDRRRTIFIEGLPAWGISASLGADAPLPFAPRFYPSLEVQRSWYRTGPCVLDAASFCGDVRTTTVYAGLAYRLTR